MDVQDVTSESEREEEDDVEQMQPEEVDDGDQANGNQAIRDRQHPMKKSSCLCKSLKRTSIFLIGLVVSLILLAILFTQRHGNTYECFIEGIRSQ